MQKYAVIMAGGGGTRFWPLSRQIKPKQLLNISGNDVMINETIKRLMGFIPLENILIVTSKRQSDMVRQLVLYDLPEENILYEPVGRNTSACIAYAAMEIKRRCQDAIMCVLPSDHYISNEDQFRNILNEACIAAEEMEKLITIGIKPTCASTGYGYIYYNPESCLYCNNTYLVESFIEKPPIEKAIEYVNSGRYLWNSGLFVWKASIILENIQRYLPRLYRSMSLIHEMLQEKSEKVELQYAQLPSISIDFGVLERSDEVLVISGDFGWNDLGSWDALDSIFPTDESGNIVRAKHIGLGTKNSIIYGGDRLITTIGMESLIIADTKDALLICPKERAQDVKSIVELIKSSGLEEYV